MSYDPHAETLVTLEEIMEMVREETLYRPARRAAAFCLLLFAAFAFARISEHGSALTSIVSESMFLGW